MTSISNCRQLNRKPVHLICAVIIKAAMNINQIGTMPAKERKVVNAPREPLLWHIVQCLETTTNIHFHPMLSNYTFTIVWIRFSRTVYFIVWTLEFIDNGNLHILCSIYNFILSGVWFKRIVSVIMLKIGAPVWTPVPKTNVCIGNSLRDILLYVCIWSNDSGVIFLCVAASIVWIWWIYYMTFTLLEKIRRIRSNYVLT